MITKSSAAALPFGAGLYVHFPWCVVRCTYCDFNTYLADSIPGERYFEAISAEAARRAPDYSGWPLRTIYFGGGTPSLWGAEWVARVIQSADTWFPLPSGPREVTLECNPGEANRETLAAYRDVGVTRLSLGVQSLDDALLGRLHRRHSAAEALAAVDCALETGFESVSADLMFALPGQSLQRWAADLETLATRGVPHLSLYQLTLEPGTAMTRDVRAGKLTLPDEDIQAAMWDAVDGVSERTGLERYEISNLARPGHLSRHNTSYWLGYPYLGLGAGAHSFRPPLHWDESAEAVRASNRKHHRSYTDQAVGGENVVVFEERIDRLLHLRERLFTGLRYLPGVDLGALSDELGLDPRSVFANEFEVLTREGLVAREGDRVRLTDRGVRFADEVAARFF